MSESAIDQTTFRLLLASYSTLPGTGLTKAARAYLVGILAARESDGSPRPLSNDFCATWCGEMRAWATTAPRALGHVFCAALHGPSTRPEEITEDARTAHRQWMASRVPTKES